MWSFSCVECVLVSRVCGLTVLCRYVVTNQDNFANLDSGIEPSRYNSTHIRNNLVYLPTQCRARRRGSERYIHTLYRPSETDIRRFTPRSSINHHRLEERHHQPHLGHRARMAVDAVDAHVKLASGAEWPLALGTPLRIGRPQVLSCFETSRVVSKRFESFREPAGAQGARRYIHTLYRPAGQPSERYPHTPYSYRWMELYLLGLFFLTCSSWSLCASGKREKSGRPF